MLGSSLEAFLYLKMFSIKHGQIVHRMLLDPHRESLFITRKYKTEAFYNVASVPVPAELPMPFPIYE